MLNHCLPHWYNIKTTVVHCIILAGLVCYSGGSKGGGAFGGLKPSPLRKKSSPYLGVSLWFGDILSEKQCPIRLRLHEKAFGAPRQLYSRLLFLSNLTPPPLTEKLDPSLGYSCFIMISVIMWICCFLSSFRPLREGFARVCRSQAQKEKDIDQARNTKSYMERGVSFQPGTRILEKY